ncbi:MAG: cytochrome-c peroxidase [Myxococcales bacterium]|nr:cytochrome-c peroxidase [Myxococcales bacterium]
MSTKATLILLLMTLQSALMLGCKDEPSEADPTPTPAADEARAEEANAPDPNVRIQGPLQALAPVETDEAKVRLGRRLFHDPILSGDGTISCSSCHSLDHGGAEARRTSIGIGGQVGPINAPPVLNAHLNFRQFWDGRAANLQEQAGGPVENPGEMGATFEQVIPRVEADAWYAERFAQVYGERGVSKETITDAIAEYERSLVTPSRFDAYVRGDLSAMSEAEQNGYRRFISTGCGGCHMGQGAGGTMYQRLGVVEDYFAARGGELTDADLGRFNATQSETDRHFFKVPLLRNVTLTAPYFHDGSQATLADAVRAMGRFQLGREIPDADVEAIVAFLGALEGELPAHARLPEEDRPPSRGEGAAAGN